DLHLDRGAGQARRVGGYEEQGRLQLSGRGVFGTGDDEDEVTFVHAGDERLAAVDEPVVAVAPGDRAEAVEVRAGLGLGDGEGHLGGAVGDAGQVGTALLLGAVAGDHGTGDGGGDHDE